MWCVASTGQTATLASAVCTDVSLSQVNGLTARAARARVVAEMTTNWERHYVHFVDADVRDVYLARMSEHATYGDHCTLVAFDSAFNVRIRVWGADVTHDTVVPSVASEAMEISDRPIINIGHRHDDSLLDHYFAVLMACSRRPH